MRALRTLMLGLGLALCPGVHAESAVYGLDHTIRAPGHAGTMRTLGYNRLALDTRPTGAQRLHTRPLWSQLRGGGQWRSTDDLDPDDTIDAALIQVLNSGFEVRISADGTPGPMRAVDEAAWARLLKQRPRAAQALVDAPQTLGLQVRALPDGLRVGQVIRQRAQSPAGAVDTRLEVLAVDDGVALLALHIEGETLRGSGRQAVRLADGMPLEVSLRLDMDAADGLPATEQRLRMVALDTLPMFDLSDSNTRVVDYQSERLAAPPFSEPSDDPTLYRDDPPPRGVLLADMLAPERLQTLAPRLVFGIALYFGLRRLLDFHAVVTRSIGRNVFHLNVEALFGLARRFTARVANGSLQRSLFLMILIGLLLAGVPMFGQTLPLLVGLGTPQPLPVIGWVLWALLVAATLGTVIVHGKRLTALIVIGAVGLVVSMIFVYLSAPDLALTQLLVEMVTIALMMMALNYLPKQSKASRRPLRKLRDIGIATLAGGGLAVLAYAMMMSPADTISSELLVRALPEAYGRNVVNVTLVDFRGFDTFGEIAVFGIAALVVHALLRWARLKPDEVMPGPPVQLPIAADLTQRVKGGPRPFRRVRHSQADVGARDVVRGQCTCQQHDGDGPPDQGRPPPVPCFTCFGHGRRF